MTILHARGVGARQFGDVYINIFKPTSVRTIKSIIPISPENKIAFDTVDEMLSAIQNVIPPFSLQIDDNKPTEQTKAAIIAEVETENKITEYHIRYVYDVSTLSGKWRTLSGYKYKKAIESESLPIKPSDVIDDAKKYSIDEIKEMILNNIKTNDT